MTRDKWSKKPYIFEWMTRITVEITIIVHRYNLGAFFLANNYFQRAEYQLKEALRIFRGFLGDEHPQTMASIAAVKSIWKYVELTAKISTIDDFPSEQS